MTSEQGDEYRREIVRRLEREDQELEAKARKAETEGAQDRRRRAEIEAARLRAELPFPAGDICPACWINHGRKSELEAVQHDDHEHFDAMQCEACGYFEERPA